MTDRRGFVRGLVGGVFGLLGLGCVKQRAQPAELPRGVDVFTGPPDDGFVWEVTYRINTVTGKVTDYHAKRVFRTLASKPWRTTDRKTLNPVTGEVEEYHTRLQRHLAANGMFWKGGSPGFISEV